MVALGAFGLDTPRGVADGARDGQDRCRAVAEITVVWAAPASVSVGLASPGGGGGWHELRGVLAGAAGAAGAGDAAAGQVVHPVSAPGPEPAGRDVGL